jgi:hypothetical protein
MFDKLVQTVLLFVERGGDHDRFQIQVNSNEATKL